MNQMMIGVTDLQRRFKSVFDDVTKNGIPYVLVRGSKPQAVLIPYEEYVKFQKFTMEEANQKFDAMMKRMQELNGHFSDEEVERDVEQAIQEYRAERRAKKQAKKKA
jgi:prevent-host-death family protein